MHPVGNAAGFVTDADGEVGVVGVEPAASAVVSILNEGVRVRWSGGPWGGVKRVRLTRKTPAHLVSGGIHGIQSRLRVWKRLRVPGGFPYCDAGYAHQCHEDYVPVHTRLGSAEVSWSMHTRLCMI